MRYQSITAILLTSLPPLATCHPPAQHPLPSSFDDGPFAGANKNVSIRLFAELEELSRIVDISYCVGTTGIAKPFECASRCDEFPNFELVDTFDTGPLMSDSCGYIVLDHGRGRGHGSGHVRGEGTGGEGRVIVAFRGTYSLANTIVDLSTVPQEYVPYPGKPGNETATPPAEGNTSGKRRSWRDWIPRPRLKFWQKKGKSESESSTSDVGRAHKKEKEEGRCTNCTVHTGFWTSWQNTRAFVVPHLERLREKYPNYQLNLVGHSLGGAVAALAGLEFEALGWDPIVTTFGEPKVGNAGLRDFIDTSFELPTDNSSDGNGPLHAGRYRRITHIDDPVPLLPLQEWGYRPHAGEIYISKPSLQPSLSDVHLCSGDEDTNCIYGAEAPQPSWFQFAANPAEISDIAGQHKNSLEVDLSEEDMARLRAMEKKYGVPIPARYKMWQLFFAHRDYFWRLGLCVMGGDPFDWGRAPYDLGDGEGDVQKVGNDEGKEELR
jgi:pimeloyl-ACP methyl ester carboxylesterase